ncbi:MAG: DEAD/DEAH box helicase [Tenuifilaceae bacterium]|jgi:ATP-dependent RNA helicase DeaD|nr:DEAD/DEAH box helicase [Tenuifilaceae bacterium]
METQTDFTQLGLSDETLKTIAEKGFEIPTPIQKLAIPVLIHEQCDIIAQAQTGTGKTAAFGLPIIEKLALGKSDNVSALILVPTRELALQVTDEINSFRGNRDITTITLYGGQSISEQQRRLRRGADVVVGTPGRILDLLKRRDLIIDKLEWAVLDEADEMLNMGFIEDIELILSHTPPEKRMLLFSATMPDRIVKLSSKFMKSPRKLTVGSQTRATDLADQIYFEVRKADKFDALTRIIDIEPEFYGLVFCRTRVDVDELSTKLLERGYACEGLHGDISQAQREKTLKKFRNKYINILVATDVAARGIDISDLTHVINYSLPQDPESYIHRIGRTGRAGKEGTAITFITPDEYRKFLFFQKTIKSNIRKEVLPNAQDIIEIKKTRIKDELQTIVESESYLDYLGMAEGILEVNSPEIAMAALLRMAFKNQLEESNYAEVRSFKVDNKGTTRLFIALGKRDGMNPKKISSLIRDKVRVPDNKIDDIGVYDEFSFVSVPFADAEAILSAFTSRDGGKPLVTKAKSRS